MAARRLVIVMIVLLVISTVVAVIAPQPPEPQEEDTTRVETEEPEDPGWREATNGGLLESIVYSDARAPKRIVAYVGDRLRLEVHGADGRLVAIPDLGLTETQTRSAPARFDLYFDQPGEYAVVDAVDGANLSLIVVKQRPAAPRGELELSPQEGPIEHSDASSQSEPADQSKW